MIMFKFSDNFIKTHLQEFAFIKCVLETDNNEVKKVREAMKAISHEMQRYSEIDLRKVVN